MASGAVGVRVVAPTAVTAVVGTALAVVVNLATDSVDSWWLWAAVGVLTVGSFLATWWLYRRQGGAAPPAEGAAGVVLNDVRASNLEAGNIRSTGTGVSITDGRFTGDVKFGDIHAGQREPHNPN